MNWDAASAFPKPICDAAYAGNFHARPHVAVVGEWRRDRIMSIELGRFIRGRKENRMVGEIVAALRAAAQQNP